MNTFKLKEELECSAQEIWTMLVESGEFDVLGSWDIQNHYELFIGESGCGIEGGASALALEVLGLNYQGVVVVAYDGQSELYNIYVPGLDGWILQDYHVRDSDLVYKLDDLIETGVMTEDEYMEKIQSMLPSDLVSDNDPFVE